MAVNPAQAASTGCAAALLMFFFAVNLIRINVGVATCRYGASIFCFVLFFSFTHSERFLNFLLIFMYF